MISSPGMSRTVFFIFFWRARVCRPLVRLCRPFMIFEGWLDSNPEFCRSKLARYRLSHLSPSVFAGAGKTEFLKVKSCYDHQCCGSGVPEPVLFNSWIWIRDKFFLVSDIARSIFWELSNNLFWGKNTVLKYLSIDPNFWLRGIFGNRKRVRHLIYIFFSRYTVYIFFSPLVVGSGTEKIIRIRIRIRVPG